MAEVTLEEALRLGIEAHKSGNIQEADRYYTAILGVKPDHPDANHNLGILAVGVGKVDQALPLFMKAVESNPSVAQFWLSLVDALIKLDRKDDARDQLAKAYQSGLSGEPFDTLSRQLAVEREPLPEFALAKVLEFYNSGEFDTVISRCSELEAQYTPSDVLYNLKGASYAALTKYQPAIDAYQEALKLNPSAAIYSNIGTVFEQKGDFNAAIKNYNKAIELNPNHAQVYYNLGNTHLRMKEFELAKASYEKAVKIKPNYPKALYNLGNVFRELGQHTQAIKIYKKALKIDPNYYEVCFNMANSFKELGQLEKAIENYNRVISLNPDFSDAYFNLGTILYEIGSYNSAIDRFITALKYNPQHAQSFNNLGVTYLDLGDLEKAKNNFERALEIKKDHVDAIWNLCGASESVLEAQKWVDKCLKVDSKFEKAVLSDAALKYYVGDHDALDELRNSHLGDHPYMRSYSWFFSLENIPKLFFHRWALFDYVISVSDKSRPFYEFGVWQGEAFKYLIKAYKKGYGFDTFTGLPEDWHNEKAGTYSSDGVVPKVEGGEFIVGMFEDTLPGFFNEKRPMASMINFDADLYSSTLCALNYSAPVIDEKTILVFDEFIMNENWEQDEYKALNEFCDNNGYHYKVIAASFFTKQVALRLEKNKTAP